MNPSNSRTRSEVHHAISTEQFNQIIEAIMDGKYSWACLLLLQCFGYNPLHYIPYRTYNRLIKENRQAEKLSKQQTAKLSSGSQSARFERSPSPQGLSKITDLAYLDVINEKNNQNNQARGGSSYKDTDYRSTKFNLVHYLTRRFSPRS